MLHAWEHTQANAVLRGTSDTVSVIPAGRHPLCSRSTTTVSSGYTCQRPQCLSNPAGRHLRRSFPTGCAAPLCRSESAVGGCCKSELCWPECGIQAAVNKICGWLEGFTAPVGGGFAFKRRMPVGERQRRGNLTEICTPGSSSEQCFVLPTNIKQASLRL